MQPRPAFTRTAAQVTFFRQGSAYAKLQRMLGNRVITLSFCSPLVILAALGCTFEPRDPVVPKSSPESEKLAERSALIGEQPRDKDGFVVPKARGLDEPSDAPPLETPDESSAHQLGHAKITLGPEPPFRDLDTLEQPPELRSPVSETALPSRWQLHRSIWVGEGYLYQAQFTPDGAGVVALSTDSGTLYYYDVKSGNLLKKVSIPNFKQFDDAEFVIMQELPNRPQVVLTRASGTQVLDLESGKFDDLELVPAATNIAHSGRFGLYGTSYRKIEPQSGSLRLQWVDGQVALEAECDNRPDDWALSRDGTMLAMVYYPADVVQLLDLKGLKVALEVPVPKWGGSVALSPDGSVMALGGEKLVLVSTKDGHTLLSDENFKNNIDDIVFTPSGDLLLVSAYDGKARSYALPQDLSTLKQLPAPQLLSHSGSANVYQLGLSRDARWLATPSGDKTIKIWKR